MIRTIFCDLDGTLLPAKAEKIPQTTLDHIKRLTDKGIIFCVASGRPYSALKKLFGEYYRRIVFICLDGALIMHRDCVLQKSRLESPLELLDNNHRATLFSRTTEVNIPENTPLVRKCDEINRLGGEIYKIALYGKESATPSTRICYENGGILEYVARTADKGTAAKTVLSKFSVPSNLTAALGDGENDIPLLLAVKSAYRVSRSHPSLIDRGFKEIASADEFLKLF